MGLYDNYKLDNSTYISQYVGNVVPELKEFSKGMQDRYNTARDTDDALTEALGNLSHLGLEGDTAYANELKQTYLNRLSGRAERSDYENMGRRTKRDALQFSSEYSPLLQRQKDMTTELQRVQQDDKIFSPEKKAQIADYISKTNSSKRNALTGDFERDEMGKIRLGAIKTWAYAKDVDINKKLADFLKAKETDINQSGFQRDGKGLMTSVKRETRSPAEIGRLAKEMMETDPEIKAMVERDVTLSTYDLSPGQMNQLANKGNVSMYDALKREGLSESMIKSNLKANGVSLEVAKLKPVDVLRQEYIKRGLDPLQADEAYVKNQVRKQITAPHVELVANLLKVDRQTLEAREDADYTARAIGAAIAAAMPSNSGEASPLIVTPDNGEAQIDVVNMQNAAVQSEAKAGEMKGHLQTAVAGVLGLSAPNGKNTPDWYNKTGRYLNDKAAQGTLLQQLKSSGRTKEANDLTNAFREYDKLNNTAVYARQNLRNVQQFAEPELKDLYAKYKTGFSGEVMQGVSPFTKKGKLSYEEFKKQIIETPVKSGGFLQAGIQNAGNSLFSSKDEGWAMETARNRYFKTLQSKAQQFGKTTQTSNTTIEPTASGYLKNQTDFVQAGLAEGSVKGVDQATGESFDDIMRKELGTSGWFRFGNNDKRVSPEERANPTSDYNKALKQLKVRINLDTRGANGEPTATVTTPSGAVRTIVLNNISPNLPTEMAARMIGGAGKYMTRGEATQHMQSAAMGAGWSSLKNINQAEIYNLRPAAKPYQLNDMYYLKVEEAGIKGGSKTNVYSIMVKDGNSFKRTAVSNKTQIGDIIQAIGGQVMEDQMKTIPSADLLKR